MRNRSYNDRLAALRKAYQRAGRSTAAEFGLDLMSLDLNEGGIRVDDGLRIHLEDVSVAGQEHEKQKALRNSLKTEMQRLSYQERLVHARMAYINAGRSTAAELVMNMMSLDVEEGGIYPPDGIDVHTYGRDVIRQRHWDEHPWILDAAKHLWANRKNR